MRTIRQYIKFANVSTFILGTYSELILFFHQDNENNNNNDQTLNGYFSKKIYSLFLLFCMTQVLWSIFTFMSEHNKTIYQSLSLFNLLAFIDHGFGTEGLG